MKRRIRVAEKGIRSDLAKAINELAERLERQRLVSLPGQSVTETANGTSLKTGGSVSVDAQESWFF